MKTMSLVKTFQVRKAFISSKHTARFLCPPPCGHFSYQEFSGGELSYKVKKRSVYGTLAPSAVSLATFTLRARAHNWHVVPFLLYRGLRSNFLYSKKAFRLRNSGVSRSRVSDIFPSRECAKKGRLPAFPQNLIEFRLCISKPCFG